MASAEDYATWIVANPDKKGTPEFDVVARAYQAARQGAKPEAPQEDTTSLRNVVGAATEPLLHLGTGAVAGPLSGLAGIAGAILPGKEGQGAEWASKVGHAATYEPVTQGGKTATGAITYPLQLLAEGADRAGGAVSDFTGSPALGAGVNAALQVAAPLGVAKGAKRYVAPAEGLFPGSGALGKAGEVIRNILDPHLGESGLDRATGRVANKVAGDLQQQVVEALLAHRDKLGAMTAGQAAAPAGSAEFSALQKIAETRNPSKYAAIEAEQEAARRKAIQEIGQTPEALDAAKADRSATAKERYGEIEGRLVNPKSDIQIMEEAIANRAASKGEALRDWGRFATGEAENITRGDNWTPVPGMPRVAGRVSEFPERAGEYASGAADAKTVANLRRNEQSYLENASLFPLLDRPSMQAALKDALKSAQEKGTYFPAAKGEKFSIANLQRIKESLDAGIAASRKSVENGNRPELSPAELEGTRKSFVDWLSNKSPEWRDARQQYAADSMPINRMEVGQYLESKLGSPLNAERGGVFAQAVRDAPGTIKRATDGSTRYSKLEDVLAPNHMEAVGNVLGELKNESAFGDLARRGSTAAMERIGAANPQLPSAGMLSPTISVTRALINTLEGKATNKILDHLSSKAHDPKEVARLMQEATPKQRQAVIDALMARNPALIGGAFAAGER